MRLHHLLSLTVLACAGAQAATTNTMLTINAGANVSGTTVMVTGTATLTNIGSGTFSATFNLAMSTSPIPFTITLTSGTTGTITGTFLLGTLMGTFGTGSATITGGTGSFAGATGSFPSLTGTATVGLAITLAVTGAGTITTSDSGGGGGPPAPAISQVLNNYGLIPAGFVNSGIAPGALFIIQGSGLADPSAQPVLQSSGGSGIPTTLNGASVKVTSGSTVKVPGFYYAIASQLALVLPSDTPLGPAQVTVTYNNQTSAPYTIQVVASAFGFDAYYGIGSGLGVATDNATGALYNYANSIPPGTTVVLWGSGLGADPARDTKFVGSAFTINGLSHVYIGGLDAPIVYQGASGYPGVNQVDVTIPAGVQPGCNVSLVGVNAAGVPTNFVTLPIGNGSCSDPAFGTAGSRFQTLSGQATVKTGFVALTHSTGPGVSGAMDAAIANFQSVSGSSFGSASGSVSVGGCTVAQSLTSQGAKSTGLDAGTITVSGPGGPVTLSTLPQTAGFYVAQLASGFIPTSGGVFPFHGGGGKDVGSFDASVVFPNPLLSWNNQGAAAAIGRSAGFPVTWTGGAPGTLVFITGNSSGNVGGQTVYGSFTCIAPQSALSFNVPGYVTAAMPAGSGGVTVANYSNYQSFAAAGLDTGFAAGFVASSVNSTFN